MMRTEVLKVYRELLKATRIAHAGNPKLIKASSMAIRSSFEESKNDNYSKEFLQGLIDEAREAARFMSTETVQIKDNGLSVEMTARKEPAGATLKVPSEEIMKNSA